ncbi:putative G-type lectin S-receptor-like serine/threonine-protein kinase At1g61610 [Phragmites australis]|uniref:putative G-type lectin S-receptor-like serine/threonine-protein kinase At1g61610 n=1 Tax=Phragmites australis TaxID=29695 RepID=UPI002D78DB32|nr:putative G-type lectin S-receptor-like serine/threonine-protein kinase At1g61610 [Phragmites australis]
MPMHSLPIYPILLFLSCSFSSMHLCASRNHLVPGKPLSAGSTLVSDDGTFALGFFSPSNSTKKHYYVGIWYNNIPQHTTVWIANRAVPITNLSSAVLALSNSTNLVLSDGNGRVLWRSNNSIAISSSPATTFSAEATLDNTGNFILRSLSNSTVLWQSFDHPTDTLLPGMNLRISHKMHALQHLISWRSLHDPSPGTFSYGADPNNFLQRFIWNGTRPHRRSPVWNSYFLLGSYMDNLHSPIYMAVHRGADDELYMSFGMPIDALSFLIRMEINYSGKVNILSWDSNMSVWTALYTEPEHECNNYDYCGPYAYCDNTGTTPTCKCLDGFEPEHECNNYDYCGPHEGSVGGRFSQGCRRKKVRRCRGGDGFLTLPHMKVPDQFLYVRNRSFDECTAECRSNCSCVAYAYANMSTRAIDEDDTRCLIWTGKMIDMEKFSQGGENLYIRMNKLSGNMSKTNTLEIVLPVVASLLAFICIGLIWIFWFRDAARKSLLDWPARFEIIKGVARALLYLHQDSRLTVIHRDLKASNVLLDAEMRPKISDFGTARIFGVNEQESSTNRVVGTFGYMAPEYALEGIISVKSDVYSFGVLLLEIVSGLKIRETGPIRGSPNLVVYAWNLWKDGSMQDLVDLSVVESCSPDETLRCIQIGLLSVQDNPNARPLMPWVVSSLDNEAIELPQPREPVYFARRNYETGGAGESYVSDMSLTTLEEGR